MNVITLCGSSRFKKEFEDVNRWLTIQGNVVFSLGVFGHSEGITFDDNTKQILDDIHRHKIDMSDEIFVINPGHYIGESTKEEIRYAEENQKRVRYFLEPLRENT